MYTAWPFHLTLKQILQGPFICFQLKSNEIFQIYNFNHWPKFPFQRIHRYSYNKRTCLNTIELIYPCDNYFRAFNSRERNTTQTHCCCCHSFSCCICTIFRRGPQKAEGNPRRDISKNLTDTRSSRVSLRNKRNVTSFSRTFGPWGRYESRHL